MWRPGICEEWVEEFGLVEGRCWQEVVGVKGVGIVKHACIVIRHVDLTLIFLLRCIHVAIKHTARIAQMVSFVLVEQRVHELVEKGGAGRRTPRACGHMHVSTVRFDALGYGCRIAIPLACS